MSKRDVVEGLHPDQGERLEFAEVAPSVHSSVDVVALLVVQSRIDLSNAVVRESAFTSTQGGRGSNRQKTHLERDELGLRSVGLYVFVEDLGRVRLCEEVSNVGH